MKWIVLATAVVFANVFVIAMCKAAARGDRMFGNKDD